MNHSIMASLYMSIIAKLYIIVTLDMYVYKNIIQWRLSRNGNKNNIFSCRYVKLASTGHLGQHFSYRSQR